MHPLAEKRVWVTRGDLAKGTVVHLKLLVRGPELDETVVSEAQLPFHSARLRWPVRLGYNHPDLVAGRYEYVVEATADGDTFRSEAIGYSLRGFAFGA